MKRIIIKKFSILFKKIKNVPVDNRNVQRMLLFLKFHLCSKVSEQHHTNYENKDDY